MKTFLALILICLMAAPAAAKRLPYDKRTIVTDDAKRSYLLEVVGESEAPRPALIVLHGGGGKGEQIREHAAFTLAEQGWAMIYPNGIGKNWSDGRTGIDGMPLRTLDDIAFLRGIIVELAEEGVINPTKVFFAGISNGGMMVLRVLCDMPELAAGAAIVAATHPVGLYCNVQTPVPQLFFHGTEDRFVPYHGGRVAPDFVRDRGQASSVPHALELAAYRNGCQGYRDEPRRDEDLDDGTVLILRVYDLCQAPLVHYIIEGGGHTWPGAETRRLLSKLVGPTSREVSATEEIERLFLLLAGR